MLLRFVDLIRKEKTFLLPLNIFSTAELGYQREFTNDE